MGWVPAAAYKSTASQKSFDTTASRRGSGGSSVNSPAGSIMGSTGSTPRNQGAIGTAGATHRRLKPYGTSAHVHTPRGRHEQAEALTDGAGGSRRSITDEALNNRHENVISPFRKFQACQCADEFNLPPIGGPSSVVFVNSLAHDKSGRTTAWLHAHYLGDADGRDTYHELMLYPDDRLHIRVFVADQVFRIMVEQRRIRPASVDKTGANRFISVLQALGTEAGGKDRELLVVLRQATYYKEQLQQVTRDLTAVTAQLQSKEIELDEKVREMQRLEQEMKEKGASKSSSTFQLLYKKLQAHNLKGQVKSQQTRIDALREENVRLRAEGEGMKRRITQLEETCRRPQLGGAADDVALVRGGVADGPSVAWHTSASLLLQQASGAARDVDTEGRWGLTAGDVRRTEGMAGTGAPQFVEEGTEVESDGVCVVSRERALVAENDRLAKELDQSRREGMGLRYRLQEIDRELTEARERVIDCERVLATTAVQQDIDLAQEADDDDLVLVDEKDAQVVTSTALLLSRHYPHGDTWMRANGAFPTLSEICKYLDGFFRGACLSEFLAGPDESQVAPVSQMVAAARVLIRVSREVYERRWWDVMAEVFKAVGAKVPARADEVDALTRFAVEEKMRRHWTSLFALEASQKRRFVDEVVSVVAEGLRREGLSAYASLDTLAETVSGAMWITVACSLSGPPLELEEELLGTVQRFDASHHRPVEGESLSRALIIFPRIKGRSKSLCIEAECE